MRGLAMGFELFTHVARFRDRDELRSGVVADELVESALRLKDNEIKGDPYEISRLLADRKALRVRRDLWKAIVKTAGTRYENAATTNFDQPTELHRNAVELVRQYMQAMDQLEKSLILFGPVGTGKDHLMMATLRCAVFRFGYTAAWVDGQSLCSAVRDNYASDETERPLVDFCCRSDLFAISDPLPSEGKLTAHQQNVLGMILDGRNRFFKPTIATVNVATKKELYDRLGDRNAERLRDKAVFVPCNWPSYRASA